MLPQASTKDEKREDFIKRMNVDKVTKMILSQMPKKAAHKGNRH